jgi:hypothetical protein
MTMISPSIQAGKAKHRSKKNEAEVECIRIVCVDRNGSDGLLRQLLGG